jgi:hypothetical protein
VLKEGFDKHFLDRHFEKGNGNFYDGGFCREIDQDLEKDSGDGVDDRADLHELRDACREGDPVKRRERLEKILDIDSYFAFTAMELLTCHWDGYNQNRNNYRIYFDARDGKAYFLPHGMDQMFNDPGFSVLNPPGALVGNTLMQDKRWRARYRTILSQVAANLDPPEKIYPRVDQIAAKLKPVLMEINPGLVQHHENRVRELKERLKQRVVNVRQQLLHKEALPLEFNDRREASVTDFAPQNESDAVIGPEDREGRACYKIATGASGRCVASWRTKAYLSRGKYAFTAIVKVEGVETLGDERGMGAGLRFTGVNRENHALGTTGWITLEYPFEVAEEFREVDLVAELRAKKGTVWFDKGSFRIVQK